MLVLVLFTSCINDTSEDAVFIKFENKTGYDLQDVEAYFFFGEASPSFIIESINHGESSDYFEIPKDSLDSGGYYYTFINALPDSSFLGPSYLKIRLGVISPDNDPERAELLLNGKYTFVLEFVPAEYLSQTLVVEEQNNNEGVFIRIRNSSDQNFRNVIAYFPEKRKVDYGSVPASQYSSYDSLGSAYRYAGITVYTDTDSLKWRPIDYVGEQPLKNGKYTYDLGIEDGLKDISRIIKD